MPGYEGAGELALASAFPRQGTDLQQQRILYFGAKKRSCDRLIVIDYTERSAHLTTDCRRP